MIIRTTLSPILLNIGSFHLRWYGFLIASAICLSYFLSLRIAKKEGIDEAKFDSIFLVTVLAGIIGARLGFVVQNLGFFSRHFKGIFYIWDGGLSIHGAIILGTLALYLTIKKYKLNFLRLTNIISPFLLISGAIGRWGNYFNQEIIGSPSNGYLKMFISPQNRPAGYENYQYFHPVFLYESILLFSAFVIYWFLQKSLKNYALVYTLITYSLIRIIVEFWRIDYKPIFLRLDLAQWISFGIIVFTAIATLVQKSKSMSESD